jgi:hypothetical protein
MNTLNRITLATVLALASVVTHAEDESDATLSNFTQTSCAQLAALSEADRAFSLIFYYGYMAGMSGATTVDNEAIDGHLAAVRDYCNGEPESRVVDAFVAALKDENP